MELISHFDDSSLIILCFVFLHFNASMPGSQSWRSSVAISAVRAIILFLKQTKISIMRVFTWYLDVRKNHHEIEEGSKPRWVSLAGVVRTSIKSLVITEYRWVFLVLFWLGVAQLMSDLGPSHPHRNLHPPLLSQTHFPDSDRAVKNEIGVLC